MGASDTMKRIHSVGMVRIQYGSRNFRWWSHPIARPIVNIERIIDLQRTTLKASKRLIFILIKTKTSGIVLVTIHGGSTWTSL